MSDHQKADVRYREISFDIRPGVSGVATVVDAGRTAGPGVVLAHGGSDDGRRFLLTEAEQLARQGATVVLPTTRFPGMPTSITSRRRSGMRYSPNVGPSVFCWTGPDYVPTTSASSVIAPEHSSPPICAQ
ncbi:MAG: hypothetical protein ACR2M5_02115 [Nakamurella sp.]